ncbi:flavin oxidoreductase [Actinoplanes sp. SE50]|uniref:flavin reductase family protein n=1 Tax=unclassified Actinoplanes TaxID=2626549 RepID=UPI00023EC439|nr:MULTISPECIES: flavin reductase family protein [unclassified Actinoplanes]AEV83601.1 putative flavin-dependent reductase [Actinoplanes sp. SE50/110]ATO82255.1 flavin oxidoreductase [Actinoplanes sp. SE50]SLL99662.1 flavin oxidoreductase [Actinoplanes sp. SE50/110]
MDLDTEPRLDVADRMRGAFRRYPTGVAVITAAGPDGPAGLTASSVASVAVDPPALSFSVLGTRSARALLDSPSLVVHLLGARHAGLAREFAHTAGDRFTPAQGWRTLPTGEPILPDAVAALRCAPMHRLPVGGSTLVVATVLEVFHGPDDDPLIHHAREFTTLARDTRGVR